MGDEPHGPVRDEPPHRPEVSALTVPTTTAVPARASAALADSRHDSGTRRRAAGRLPSHVLLGLQRTHGNAAVCHLVAAPARTPASKTARLPAETAAPAQVQRCGGEVHEGCGCAAGTEPPAVDSGPTVAEEAATDANGPAVQRDGPGTTPPVDKLAIPPDSPYAATPAFLMNVFKESYRNNTMMFTHGPDETLVQVLDKVGMSVISIASEIYERMQARGIWSFVRDITWVWLTTSRGLTFNTTGGLRAAVNTNASFCKEFLVASMAYHGMTEMWREFVTTGTPGLHIGAAEEPASVHIDMHQVAVPFRPQLVPGIPIAVDTGYCDYDPVALVGHWGDLQGNDSTVFSRAENARSRMNDEQHRIEAARQSAPTRTSDIDALAARLDRAKARMDAILPRLRMLSTAGMEGEQQATAAYDGEIGAINTEETDIHQAVTDITSPPPAHPPDPLDGGVGADDEE